ncbi:Tetrahedral aminopeptidase [uncultured archaeon]|nr:Tetrahedral aminopeptidase [uncultured archaeon]
MVDFPLLAKLSEAFGVPSEEHEIAALMVAEFKKRGYRTEIDRFGNVIAKSPKCKTSPVMVAAHMDEIGLMVKFITDKGFLRFIKVGGIDDRTLINQRVVIPTENGKIYGVIGHKPPHVQKKGSERRAPEAKDLFIDVGAKSKKEAEKMGIRIGTPVGFDMPARHLANGRITAKALDNRAGCYAMLQLAEVLKNEDVVLVGSTQEEVSAFGKGAALSAYHLQPRAFIALDTAVAGDHPEISEEDTGGVSLDKGPVITLVEASAMGNVADRILREHFMDTARKAKIAVQLEVVEGGATDAASVYSVRGGIPSIAIGIPTRYIHSNVSVCSGKDIAQTVTLMERALKTWPKK